MRRPFAVWSVFCLVFAAAACGREGQGAGDGDALCSPSYEPRELVDHGPLPLALPSAPGRTANPSRTTDAATIRKIASAACALPTPPEDLACTLELGPSYELRFLDARGRTTTLTAQSYGCQFVEGLASRRFGAKPLWDALIAAGLPAPHSR